MFKTLAAAATAALVLGTAAFAAPVELSDQNTAHIRQMLTDQGYEVAKIKIEDGLYEAYAKKDGKRLEVFLDGDFNIVRME